MRLSVVQHAPSLVQPMDGDILVSPVPVPAGWRIRAINLVLVGSMQSGDSLYCWLGLSRGDGSDFVRVDDSSHTNELSGERIITSLPLSIVSDGQIHAAAYVLSSSVSTAYRIRFCVLCEVPQ